MASKNTSISPDDADFSRYIVLEVSYSTKWIMPIKEGTELLALLQHAKLFKDNYSEKYLKDAVEPITCAYWSERDLKRKKLELAIEDKGDEQT